MYGLVVLKQNIFFTLPEDTNMKERKRASMAKTKKVVKDGSPNSKWDGVKVNGSSRSLKKQGSSTPSNGTKSLSFLEKMRAKLSGGHFRMINEKLYTCTGREALTYFNDETSLFQTYHAGYQEQMSHWPEQPVKIIINWLKDRSPDDVVADFGCGDARLARSVNNKVFSFDLVAHDPSVIACDMSNTPLSDSSVDVAVFCLSLMGTNYGSYLEEACRVLKPRGWLLIAEIKSRFDPTSGGADPEEFAKAVSKLGFIPKMKDFSNKMFFILHFQKEKNASGKKDVAWPALKPCIYKRR